MHTWSTGQWTETSKIILQKPLNRLLAPTRLPISTGMCSSCSKQAASIPLASQLNLPIMYLSITARVAAHRACWETKAQELAEVLGGYEVLQLVAREGMQLWQSGEAAVFRNYRILPVVQSETVCLSLSPPHYEAPRRVQSEKHYAFPSIVCIAF
ncbi:unnamed protein product [Caretta caretta]